MKHSTHLHVGGDKAKVEGGLSRGFAKPIYKTKPYFTFTLDFFIFENKVSEKKMQLDRKFAAVECSDR